MQHDAVLFRNRNQCYLWLTGLLVCTMGGWFFGATLKAPRSTKITQNNLPRSSTLLRTIQEKGFAAGSPQRLWIDKLNRNSAAEVTNQSYPSTDLRFEGFFIGITMVTVKEV
jgi:hypothetical protein